MPVPAPLGVAPPPLIIVDVPPVACDFSLLGTVTVVVEVVTVVGMVADGAFATSGDRVCGCNGWEATAGAASSGGSALESVTGAVAAFATWWLGGATSAGRACRWWCVAGTVIVCWSSTAPPAVTTAAASNVATCVAPALIAPTPTTADPVPAPAPALAASAPPAAPLPAPPTPSMLASTPSGPSVGTIAPNRRLTPRSWWRNSRQPAQSRMWRRAVAFGRSPRSWERISSSRMSEHAVSRASSAWPSPSRARTSSDFTAGTVTPSAPAMSA